MIKPTFDIDTFASVAFLTIMAFMGVSILLYFVL